MAEYWTGAWQNIVKEDGRILTGAWQNIVKEDGRLF
jgi:thiamine phosphate synthase YjbQ (UPF0047 family)